MRQGLNGFGVQRQRSVHVASQSARLARCCHDHGDDHASIWRWVERAAFMLGRAKQACQEGETSKRIDEPVRLPALVERNDTWQMRSRRCP